MAQQIALRIHADRRGVGERLAAVLLELQQREIGGRRRSAKSAGRWEALEIEACGLFDAEAVLESGTPAGGDQKGSAARLALQPTGGEEGVGERPAERAGEVESALTPVHAKLAGKVGDAEAEPVEPGAAVGGEPDLHGAPFLTRVRQEPRRDLDADPPGQVVVAESAATQLLRGAALSRRRGARARSEARERLKEEGHVWPREMEIAMSPLCVDGDPTRTAQLDQMRAGSGSTDPRGASELGHRPASAVEQTGEHGGARAISQERCGIGEVGVRGHFDSERSVARLSSLAKGDYE